MPTTKILDKILLPRHLKYGLHLDEISDHFVILQTQFNKPVAYFTQNANIEQIHKAADKWLQEADLIGS